MSKRTFVISDIHGCHDEFNKLLKECGYNSKTDHLILLGDYVDRGFKSKEVVSQVMKLVYEDDAIALRGNHDQMFLDIFSDEPDDYLFLHNGGISTIESYCGLNWFEGYQGFDYMRYLQAKEFILKHYTNHIQFLRSLRCHYEDDNHIYVHAGLHPMYENWKEQPAEHFIWIRDIFLNNKTSVDKMVVFGHTPTVNLHNSAEVWFSEEKIGIDGGCVFGYKLNCLEIIEGSYNTHSVDSRLKRDD
ncbi:metallophosphoesterase family protein [Paenibacillus cremeus]|uniref:Serine/threonine protein phosphatase n=1 Tax=Paenibacillus cremeus TaxID=2163881 RepID=A0A559KCJ7_9BACL|nr:metallophosphoesterase family protein [Paenibacillus cremeus]TVY09833.1 serine/threonine protein phosphatase [Paenibacillus cremeus]